VKDLKLVLHEKSAVPADRQRLIYKAKLLSDDHPLSNYIKEDGETLHLVKKPSVAEQANVPQASA